MRYTLLLGLAGIVLLGLLVQRGWGEKPSETERTSISSEEYHYRQVTVTPYSAFMRQE